MNRELDELRAGFHPELLHHLVFVGLGGAGGNVENRSDFLHGFALGDEGEHFGLAVGEAFGQLLNAVEAFVQNAAGDARGNITAAREHFLDGNGEFVAGGVFQYVSHNAAARFEGLEHQFPVIQHGQENGPRINSQGADSLDGLETVEPGHVDIDNKHIGFVALGERDEFLAAGGASDDIEVFAEKLLQGFEQNFMVVGEQEASFVLRHFHADRKRSRPAKDRRAIARYPMRNEPIPVLKAARGRPFF